jgi:tetratricopeptide (TPR) repeat protein
VSQGSKPPNDPLRAARLRLTSPSGSGRSMSRQELADAVNTYLAAKGGRHRGEATLDANHIGKLERGEHRWPNALRREAFRRVLNVATDEELGFFIVRGLATAQRNAVLPTVPRAMVDAAQNQLEHLDGQLAAGPDGYDLWELNDVLRRTRISRERLRRAEAACVGLDARYAELPAQVLLPNVSVQLRATVRALQESQRVDYRRRLCALAGRLAGLRAWLLFDLADHHASDAWYDAAIQAAHEADEYVLCGWLFGARSLIPSYRNDHHSALDLIQQGQSVAARSADNTVRAWLCALEARARAGVGDINGFHTAERAADRLVSRTHRADRRHGMDFDGDHLDLCYYLGTGRLLLRQPKAAVEYLQRSLDILPSAHAKARAILLLALAAAAAQQRRTDEAAGLVARALVIAAEQPIMPILQRARDVRDQLHATDAKAVTCVDERLDDFAARLRVPELGSAP